MRVLVVCEESQAVTIELRRLGLDIDAAIRRKMEINKGRAWKHGKE